MQDRHLSLLNPFDNLDPFRWWLLRKTNRKIQGEFIVIKNCKRMFLTLSRIVTSACIILQPVTTLFGKIAGQCHSNDPGLCAEFSRWLKNRRDTFMKTKAFFTLSTNCCCSVHWFATKVANQVHWSYFTVWSTDLTHFRWWNRHSIVGHSSRVSIFPARPNLTYNQRTFYS